VSLERYARRAAQLAADQVRGRAHVLPGAGGARPGLADGARRRPDGVTLVAPRADPVRPAVFAAQCDGRVCAGRYDQAAGGIAGGRAARPTDIDLLVYLAELAALREEHWQPFFEFFSPRRIDADPSRGLPDRLVWGEDCRGRRHFDSVGLVNWCFERAVDARYTIAFDAAAWAADTSGAAAVPLTDPTRPADLVFADSPGGGAVVGILVGRSDPSARGPAADEFGDVVLAEHTDVGVVRRPFAPAAWAHRRRPTAEVLHD
jgi:hypothetical protein